MRHVVLHHNMATRGHNSEVVCTQVGLELLQQQENNFDFVFSGQVVEWNLIQTLEVFFFFLGRHRLFKLRRVVEDVRLLLEEIFQELSH